MVHAMPSMLFLRIVREFRKSVVLLLCLFLLVIIIILKKNYYSKDNLVDRIPNSYKIYCNHHIPYAHEGQFEGDSGYALRGAVVISRHGDRSAMGSSVVTGKKHCGPIDDHQQTIYNGFQEFLHSSQFSKRVLVDSVFDSMPALASEYCTPAFLTVPGLVQLHTIGQTLREAYKRWKLWDVDSSGQPHWHISLRSTHRERTYQSALAFLHGLTGTAAQLQAHTVHLNSSKSLHFCMQQWCNCFNLDDRYQQYTDDRAAYFRKHAKAPTRKVVDFCPPFFKNIPLFEVNGCMDVLAATYVCKNFSLPCMNTGSGGSNVCVTLNDLANLFDFITERDRYIANKENTRAVMIMQAIPLLRKIGKVMNMVAEATDRNYFMYYSTHDTTIIPLLSVLGLYEGVWPRYADHITFEIWQKVSDQLISLRILHNGQDVTKDTSICLGHNLCSRRDYFNFINDRIHTDNGFEHFDDICTREK